MPIRIKICGITSLDDALAALEAGADALGFIFFPASPRSITPEQAGAITARLPPFVTKVGVFVDEPRESIGRIRSAAGLNAVQLHGDEPPEEARALGGCVIKAFRIKDRSSLARLGGYDTAAFLLDSYVPGQPGGTGARFNWDLALEAKSHGRPIILAGGLTPGNVAEAVAKVQPYGLDVSSGVETSPGRKDHRKLRDFIRRARGLAAG